MAARCGCALVEPPIAELTRDGVEEGRAGQDVRRLEVFDDQFDGAPAGAIGHLPALAIGGGNGGAAGQRQAERFGHGVHGRGRAHGVAVADRRGRIERRLEEFFAVDLAGGVACGATAR